VAPLLSVTMETAIREMLLTGPDVAVPSPCPEVELLNRAPLGFGEGRTPTGPELSEQ